MVTNRNEQGQVFQDWLRSSAARQEVSNRTADWQRNRSETPRRYRLSAMCARGIGMADVGIADMQVNTLSVPITSRGASGRTFLQWGRRGTSHRLAKAFVVVTRRGCASPSRLTRRKQRQRYSRPSRTTGKSRAPASVNERGRGRRRKETPAILLQLSNLMGDRRRRNAELGRGVLEAHVPRGGLEGAQLR